MSDAVWEGCLYFKHPDTDCGFYLYKERTKLTLHRWPVPTSSVDQSLTKPNPIIRLREKSPLAILEFLIWDPDAVEGCSLEARWVSRTTIVARLHVPLKSVGPQIAKLRAFFDGERTAVIDGDPSVPSYKFAAAIENLTALPKSLQRFIAEERATVISSRRRVAPKAKTAAVSDSVESTSDPNHGRAENKRDQVRIGADLTHADNQKSFPERTGDSEDRRVRSPKGLPPPWISSMRLVGRERSVASIKDILGLCPNIDGPQQVIVSGTPGVGKTSITSALSRDPDIIAIYPEVLWTALGETPDLFLKLASWGRALGTDQILRCATIDEAIDHIRGLLRDASILLIVDDVWDVAHGALFQKLQSDRTKLIITTRLNKVADLLSQNGGRDIYSLPVLDEKDAFNLFEILAPDVAHHYYAECVDLLRDLEYLPLSIQVAARLLRTHFKNTSTIESLIEEIRSGTAVVRSLAPADRLIDGAIPTVQALLQKSTDLLSAEAKRCFALLDLLPPKPATFNLERIGHIWNVTNEQVVARELIDHGLIEPLGGNRFQIHALLKTHAGLVGAEFD